MVECSSKKEKDISTVESPSSVENGPQAMTQNNKVDRNEENEPDQDQSAVELVVAKAKRAAASLWMVLHAQNCHLPAGNCPYQGCEETKKVLLHVKQCSAATPSSLKCPENYNGCSQVKKLMAHYFRCRTNRVKMNLGMENQKSCLLCTFVARHAQDVRKRSIDSVSSVEGGNVSNKKVSFRVGGDATTPTGRTLPYQHEPPDNVVCRRLSNEIMPPPPPRISVLRSPRGKERSHILEDGEINSQPERSMNIITSEDCVYPSTDRGRKELVETDKMENGRTAPNSYTARTGDIHVIHASSSEQSETIQRSKDCTNYSNVDE